MALTSIGTQRTPGRPSEITFGAETGLPADSRTVLLIGRAASGATGTNTVINIANSGDADLTTVTAEVNTKFGAGSEMAKMVIAAVKANAGGSSYPPLKAVPLASTETTIPAGAQTAILATPADYIASCYDLSVDSASRTVLKTLAQTMSGAQRVHNNQFGSFGVGVNRTVVDPSTLANIDTQFLIGCWMRDTGTSGNLRPYSIGEDAAACAARMAANGIPFNPQDDQSIGSVPAPLVPSDWITVGAGLESESCLLKGWTPLRTKPNGEVAFVRTVTGRLSADGTGTPVVQAYYDVQDFNVLYFWRRTFYTRMSQPDMKTKKASANAANEILSEAIRLAVEFEDQNMFQAVALLAKLFKVQRNASDRHRFDVYTPVNVIPGLHVIANNTSATTLYDVLTV